MEKIDTHLHLIYKDQFDYPWLASFPPLDADFVFEDYAPEAKANGVTGAIFMEVDVAPAHAAGEVEMVRKLAVSADPAILGILAAAHPEDDDFDAQVDRVIGEKVKGLRRVLHTQPDECSTGDRFRKNVASLGKRGLTFDVCVLGRQLPLAVQLADACPDTRLILDHCGVPDIAGGDVNGWARDLKELARREQVACKISGLTAYCPAGKADVETLRPWVETAIEAFGWDRVVWGSDWPVCTVNSTLTGWTRILDEILSGESDSNLAALYAGNARQIYQLD